MADYCYPKGVLGLYKPSECPGRDFFGRFYNTLKHKIKKMKDDSEQENIFEDDSDFFTVANETNISESLTLAGNIFIWIGWIVIGLTFLSSISAESPLPLLFGTGSLLTCWISSLLLKGLSKIIDLLVDIKNK